MQRNTTTMTIAGMLAMAASASAGVIMQVSEDPNIDTRFAFLGDLGVLGSTPIDVEATGSTTSSGGFVRDYAHGRVNHTGIGLRARQTSTNALDRGFEVFSRLRYDDLIFSSDDSASSVSGTVQLRLPGAGSMGFTMAIAARSNNSAAGGQYSRIINVFGDRESTQGLLSGYSGSGMITVHAPLTFSTLVPEMLEIEMRIIVRTFTAGPLGITADVDANYVDTLRLNPGHLISFTSGVNPDVNSATGEIMGNRIVIPGPSAIAMLGLGLLGRRRR